jgi:hypothetical protein
MTIQRKLGRLPSACVAAMVLLGGAAMAGAPGILADFEDPTAIAPPVLRDEDPSKDDDSKLDESVAHSGSRSLRVDYDFARRRNSVNMGPFAVYTASIPDDAWGLEFHVRSEEAATLRLLLRLEEYSLEVWDADLPLIIDKESAGQWQRVRIPLAWFRLITWERRDGRLNLADLASLRINVRGGTNDPQAGTLWVDSVQLVDAVHIVPPTTVNEDGYLPIDLDGAFDTDAIAWRTLPTDGDFHTGEWEPRTLPAENFPEEAIADFGGVPFRTPPKRDGANNHFRSNGQVIRGFQPGKFTVAYVLASGKFGDQIGDAALQYSDGTEQKVALRISDWSMTPQFSESIGLLLPYAYHRSQLDRYREPRLFVQSLRVDPERELIGIRLPTNDYLKVFGITLTNRDDFPKVGEFSDHPLAVLDPRLEMADKATIDFTQPVKPVGVLGGYVVRRSGSYGLDIPTHNGFLTFTADARHLPQGLLVWHNFQNRQFRLGGVEVPSETSVIGEVEFLDQVTLRYHGQTSVDGQQHPVSMHVSRAWPGAMYDVDASTFSWIDSPERTQLYALFPTTDDEQIVPLRRDTILPEMSEPWILLFHRVPEDMQPTHETRDFASPILVVLERKPQSMTPRSATPPLSAGIDFQFEGAAGKVSAMPLFGIRRIEAGETRQWADDGVPADTIEAARVWSRRLQRFPVALSQEYLVDEDAGTVTIRDSFKWMTMQSEWGVSAEVFTPLSPTVMLAADNGYGMLLPADLIRTSVSTFYGPLAGRKASGITYTIPIADHVSSMLTLTRATGHPLLEEARAQLTRRIDESIPDDLDGFTSISDISQDVAQLRLISPSRLQIGDDPQRVAYARAVVENAFKDYNLKLEKEPQTGQYYLMDDRFWAKDALYDKEWSIGFILQGLWSHAYYDNDWGFIADHWNDIRGLYRYYQLHFDWATNSTFTMTTGSGANSDGMRIAYDGMLAMARMAGSIDDDATREDAVVRSARQRLSLYASWFGAQWAADHDYVMARNRHVRPEEAELRFSPDHLWSEFFTNNTSHTTDFFQTNHAFFAFNLAHLTFLHDVGLDESRLRSWIFETIPQLHPNWCDGNARVPGGGRYYGDAHAMSLLIARAILFEGTLEDAFDCLRQATDGTAVMEEWYAPTGLIPMMLSATITGSAPRVIVPVQRFAIIESTYDVQAGLQRVVLERTRGGNDILRIRSIADMPTRVTVNGQDIVAPYDGKLRYSDIPLDAGIEGRIVIEVQHVVP